MKIYIKKSDNSEFVLCEGIDTGENVEDWDQSHDELVQVAQFLRAVTAAPIARGNTQTAISFRITREHADAKTCEAYIMTHHALIPKSGDVIFVAEGSGQARYMLSAGSLQSHRGTQIGVTSIHTYRIIGGDFTEATS